MGAMIQTFICTKEKGTGRERKEKRMLMEGRVWGEGEREYYQETDIQMKY